MMKSLLETVKGCELTMFARIGRPAAARKPSFELVDKDVSQVGGPQGRTPLLQSDRRI